jgi:hypothetical protein
LSYIELERTEREPTLVVLFLLLDSDFLVASITIRLQKKHKDVNGGSVLKYFHITSETRVQDNPEK